MLLAEVRVQAVVPRACEMGGRRSDFVDLDVNGSLLPAACQQAAGTQLEIREGATFCAPLLAVVFTFA
jgi:hypothetical protein